MKPVSRVEIDAANGRIRAFVRRTPVFEVGSELTGTPVVLKLENLQHSGSFKVRPALNRLLACDVPADGAVAASGGNLGLGVAYAAQLLGHKATIFVPGTSPEEKIAGLRRLGADVRVVDGYYPEALEASRAFAAEHDVLTCHAYDQPEVVAGNGTVGREIDEQVPGVDTVLVAVGGGGLIAGIAGWFQERVRVLGVETEKTPTFRRALDAGEPVDVEVGGLAASSLGAGRIGAHTWAARAWIDDSLLVPDDAVRGAQRLLWERTRLIAEPGGVVALAALTTGVYEPRPGERVAVVVCGANTDPAGITDGL